MNKLCKILLVIVFILMFALWGYAAYIDIQNVNNMEDGQFCLKRETKTFDDGKIDICYGLGYKTYYYDRECFKGLEFAPFFYKDRTLSIDECNN